MSEDKMNQMPEKDIFKFVEAACSPEFSSEGCIAPAEDAEESK